MKNIIFVILLLISAENIPAQKGIINPVIQYAGGWSYWAIKKQNTERYRSQMNFKQNFSGNIEYDGKIISSDSIKISRAYLVLEDKKDSINLYDKKLQKFIISDNLRNIEVDRISHSGEKLLKLKMFEISGLAVYNNALNIDIRKTQKQGLLFVYNGKSRSRNFYINGKDNDRISHFLKRFDMQDEMIASVLEKLNNL